MEVDSNVYTLRVQNFAETQLKVGDKPSHIKVYIYMDDGSELAN